MEDFYIEEDEEWINELEKEDDLYNDFYLEKINNVELHLIYIDKHNNIEHIKKDKYFFDNQTIYKDNLLHLLKKNSIYQNNKYKLLSIIQYNIDLLPENVNDYLINNKNYDFFNIRRTLNNIIWKDSITLFKDINSLYIIYYDNQTKNNNTTKKIYIKSKRKKRNQNKTKRKNI